MKTKPLRSKPGDTSFHAIMIEDVFFLETIEAKRTEEGWVIPQWLVDLRLEVEKRDGLDEGASKSR